MITAIAIVSMEDGKIITSAEERIEGRRNSLVQKDGVVICSGHTKNANHSIKPSSGAERRKEGEKRGKTSPRPRRLQLSSARGTRGGEWNAAPRSSVLLTAGAPFGSCGRLPNEAPPSLSSAESYMCPRTNLLVSPVSIHQP